MTNTQTVKSKVMPARYAGTCRICKGYIRPGDQIEWSANTGAIHADPRVCKMILAAQKSPEAIAPAPVDPSQLEAGLYETPKGEIFRVQISRESGNRYAKRMIEITGKRLTETDNVVNVDFKFESGAVWNLRPEWRMDFDRAKELSIRYRHCLACGIFLKDATSVAEGIGPICRKKSNFYAKPADVAA